jgi:hypothetical protein
MNKKISVLAGIVVLGIALPMAATAAGSVLDEAARCSKVLGERERLVCFDRVFPVGTEASELSSRVAPAPALPAAAPAAAAAVAVGATAVAVAPSSSSAFAEEAVRARNKTDEERAAEVKNMTAQISGMKETRANVWRLSLDNGQIWQQQEMSNGFMPKSGNTIRVEKGKMGGYYMALIGESRSPWVRVTRVQ